MNKDLLLDILSAIAIGLLLAIGALAYFDVLTKWGKPCTKQCLNLEIFPLKHMEQLKKTLLKPSKKDYQSMVGITELDQIGGKNLNPISTQWILFLTIATQDN